MSVSAPAIRPPVQDSAVAIFSLRAKQASSTRRARMMYFVAHEFSRLVQGSRTVAIASAAIPSCRPGKAQPLRGRRLDRHAVERQVHDLGDFRADGVAMRADLGTFADQGGVDMGDAAAARGDAFHGVAQEQVGRGAAPLRIARREMRADVAVGDGAEHGVGDRVQQHVGVRMADQPVIVRHLHAAEPDMVALAEGVDIKTLARADVRQIVEHSGFGAQKILTCGQLDVVGFAGEDENAMAGPFRHGGVVGQFAAAVGAHGPMGGENEPEPERLRRLHGAQRRTVGRRHDALVLGDFLDRVDHGKAGNRRAFFARGVQRPSDQSGPHEGPGRVMDQHRRVGARRPKPSMASRPLQTLSCRVAPPNTGGSRRARRASGSGATASW